MRAGIDAVLLDVDDTLVDTRAAFRAALDVVATTHLHHLGEDAGPLALEHWVRDAEGHFGSYTRGEVGFVEQRRRRVGALHRDLGGAVLDDEGFATWNDAYERAFTAAWRPLPGAVELVRALVDGAVPCGAVTNAESTYQREKLARTGLGDLPVLVGTDALGLGKPDPRVWHLACERLSVAPGRAVHVGDEPQVDAVGALRAGLQAVWFDTGHRDPPRVGDGPSPARVRSLAELGAWLGLPGW